MITTLYIIIIQSRSVTILYTRVAIEVNFRYVYRHLGTVEPLYNEVLVTIFSEYNNIYEKEPRYDESSL